MQTKIRWSLPGKRLWNRLGKRGRSARGLHAFHRAVWIALAIGSGSVPVTAFDRQALPERRRVDATPVDPETGIVHSQRLESGVPLGGVGTGTFQILTDGSISHATITNNWQQPTGDLPACFAAIWTRTGNRTAARVLALQNAYRLPTMAALDYDGLYPQARLTYPDAALPVSVSLLAFSPLIPFDLKNSSFPAAAFVFRLHNPAPVTVEVSVALSWENILGVGGTARAPLHDRTGDAVTALPDADGYFGMQFTGPPPADPPDRLRESADGEIVLMTHPPRKEAIVTMAGWNALDARPGWWDGFAREGSVAGNAPQGLEGKAHPAGVVVVQLTLRPKDYVDIPFAVAWSIPKLHTRDGRDHVPWYTLPFPDASRAARVLLADWRSLHSLTEEWQKRLLFSNLPGWLARRCINAATPLTTHSLHTRDERFVLLGNVGAEATAAVPEKTAPEQAVPLEQDDRPGVFAVLSEQFAAERLLLAFFPHLAAQELLLFAAAQTPEGAIPASVGDLDGGLGPQQPATPAPPAPHPHRPTLAEVQSAGAFTRQLARYIVWTDDRSFLLTIMPHVRRALYYALPWENRKVLPDAIEALPGRRWLEAIQAGQTLAERAEKGALLEALQQSDPNALAVLLVEAEADQRLAKACAQALARGEGEWKQRFGTAQANLEDPTAQTFPTFGVALRTATHAFEQGRPEAGLAMLKRLDDLRNNLLRSPWQTPAAFPDQKSPLPPPGPASLVQAGDWNAFFALVGAQWDVEAGCLTLKPALPGEWRNLDAALFAPTFWGHIVFKPTAKGGILIFRLDRLIGLTAAAPTLKPGPSTRFILRAVRVPGLPTRPGRPKTDAPTAHASLGQNPIGSRVTREPSGDLLLTFETPLALAVGDRLEVDIH